jgi:hypothetical protein
MQIILKNPDYSLYQIDLVKTHQKELITAGKIGIDRFQSMFSGSTTWNYRKYNLFALTAGYKIYYELYKEITKAIRDYLGHDKPLWMQSWINYHMPDEVLGWHAHEDIFCHGYISIEPHNTKTVFREYEIINKVGTLYVGKNIKDNKYLEHKVEILEPFTSPRITIAFDIIDEYHAAEMVKKYGRVELNLSFIPI